jgi:hypothetical protein
MAEKDTKIGQENTVEMWGVDEVDEGKQIEAAIRESLEDQKRRFENRSRSNGKEDVSQDLDVTGIMTTEEMDRLGIEYDYEGLGSGGEDLGSEEEGLGSGGEEVEQEDTLEDKMDKDDKVSAAKSNNESNRKRGRSPNETDVPEPGLKRRKTGEDRDTMRGAESSTPSSPGTSPAPSPQTSSISPAPQSPPRSPGI